MSAGRVQVVVDDSACLPDDVAREHGITVVPLGLDDADGDAQTSAIGPLPLCAAYARALERGGDAGVVALHLSKGLSATWSNAVTAAAVLDRVVVVDSPMVGAGMGAAAVAAAKRAAEGADLDECVAVAEDVLDRTRLWLFVPKLEPLRRGGRISTGQAVLSTALAIKPIVGIQDGTLGLVAKCRTEAKVMDKLVAFAAAEAAGRPAHVLLQHSGARERVEELHAMLSLELPEGSTFDVVELPAALVAHTGQGAYAVAMVVDETLAAADAAGTADAEATAGTEGTEGAEDDPGPRDDAGVDGHGRDRDGGAAARATGAAGPAGPAGAGAGREVPPLFTTVTAKLPTWSENRSAAREKAEALAHAIAELARRDNSDPEGAKFGDDAKREAAEKAAGRAGRAARGDDADAGAGAASDATPDAGPDADAARDGGDGDHGDQPAGDRRD